MSLVFCGVCFALWFLELNEVSKFFVRFPGVLMSLLVYVSFGFVSFLV